MRPVPLTPAPEEPKALLKWCKEMIVQISRASQVDTPVAKDKQNTGKFLAKAANLSDVADPAASFDNIKQDATESYKGVVELATEEETVQGASNTLGTHPKGVAAAIAAAIAEAIDALRDGVSSSFDTLKKLADGLATKLTAADNLSDVADPAQAFDNIKQVATSSETGVVLGQQTIWAPFLIPAPEDKDYPVIVGAAESFTITSVTTKTGAGSATVTVKINDTPLGGNPNSATTSKSTETHSTDNVVQAGDDVTITVDDTDDCEDLSITIAGTMELATS